jgi:phospholipid/cholesterol/gamma-HCH transport system substrate-binding protein
MENKSHAFWAGLFAIGLSVAIGLAVFWFNLDRTVRVPYDLVSRSAVTGLTTDAAVRYRGLDVGKVQSLRFDPAHPGQIIIRILVDKHAPMTHSTFGTLALQGVTGLAFVQLDDTGADPRPIVSSAKHVAQLPMRAGLLEQLQERGDVLLHELESVATRADAMLSPEVQTQLLASAASIQHAADAVTVLAHAAGPAATQLPATLTQLQHTLASANALVTNLNAPRGPLYSNLERLGSAADRASAAITQMDASLENMSTRVQYETLPRMNELAADVGGGAGGPHQRVGRRRGRRGALDRSRRRGVRLEPEKRAVRRRTRGAWPGRGRIPMARGAVRRALNHAGRGPDELNDQAKQGKSTNAIFDRPSFFAGRASAAARIRCDAHRERLLARYAGCRVGPALRPRAGAERFHAKSAVAGGQSLRGAGAALARKRRHPLPVELCRSAPHGCLRAQPLDDAAGAFADAARACRAIGARGRARGRRYRRAAFDRRPRAVRAGVRFGRREPRCDHGSRDADARWRSPRPAHVHCARAGHDAERGGRRGRALGGERRLRRAARRLARHAGARRGPLTVAAERGRARCVHRRDELFDGGPPVRLASASARRSL